MRLTTGTPSLAAGQRYPFAAFTALTALGLPLLLLWLDKPLALALHRHATRAVPWFMAGTNAIDRAYDATNVGGRPMLLLGLAVAYVLGRWLLRRRSATVLLVVLLTHLSSGVSANLLKVVSHRQRPTFVGGQELGGQFGSAGSRWDSFPSSHTALYWGLCWPLAVAYPRWRGPLLAVPVFIALGRLVLGAHYLSDVWAAIWLAVAWAALWRALARLVRA